MKLWLDDMRPAPIGWLWVQTIQEAKEYLKDGIVSEASLDHDLGACPECYKKMGVSTPHEWLEYHNWDAMPNCEHFGTGYQLVCWMEDTGFWPHNKPTVHSANPVGRKKMQQAIDRYWGA